MQPPVVWQDGHLSCRRQPGMQPWQWAVPRCIEKGKVPIWKVPIISHWLYHLGTNLSYSLWNRATLDFHGETSVYDMLARNGKHGFSKEKGHNAMILTTRPLFTYFNHMSNPSSLHKSFPRNSSNKLAVSNSFLDSALSWPGPWINPSTNETHQGDPSRGGVKSYQLQS